MKNKAKFLVLITSSDECDIICQDGGIATVHHNDEHLLTTYYQNRIEKPISDFPNLLDYLAEGKVYLGDWDGKKDDYPEKHEHDMEVYKDAAHWLFTSTEEHEFEFIIKKYDDSSIEEINKFIQFESVS